MHYILHVRIASLLAAETWASPLLQQLPAYLSYVLATGCSLIGEDEGLLTHAHTSVLSPGLHAVALAVSLLARREEDLSMPFPPWDSWLCPLRAVGLPSPEPGAISTSFPKR